MKKIILILALMLMPFAAFADKPIAESEEILNTIKHIKIDLKPGSKSIFHMGTVCMDGYLFYFMVSNKSAGTDVLKQVLDSTNMPISCKNAI